MAFSLFKKKSQSSVSSIPNLPQNNIAVGMTPLKKGAKINKKILIASGAVLSMILIGLTTFIALRSQPQTVNSHAAVLSHSGCATFTVPGTQVASSQVELCPDGEATLAGGDAVGHFYVMKTTSDNTPVTVNIDKSSFWCPEGVGNTSCNLNSSGSSSESFTVTNQNEHINFNINRSSDNGQACGSFQFDTTIEGNGPVWQFASTESDCTSSPTNTPTPTPTPIAANTPTPTFGPSPTPIAGRVSGQVLLYACGDTMPPQIACSPVDHAKGLNGRTVTLMLNGVQVDTTTTVTNGYPGYFVFNNVNAGTYQACTNNPGSAAFYCANNDNSGTAQNFCNTFTIQTGEEILSRYIVMQSTLIAGCTPGPTNTPTPPQSSITPPGLGTPPPTTPTPGGGTTIQDTPSPTPKASLTPSPTPTNTVVLITATPTPTTIIVVGATNTPGPTTLAQSTPAVETPTIPSAGNPLPYIAVAIPFILILLAFVL